MSAVSEGLTDLLPVLHLRNSMDEVELSCFTSVGNLISPSGRTKNSWCQRMRKVIQIQYYKEAYEGENRGDKGCSFHPTITCLKKVGVWSQLDFQDPCTARTKLWAWERATHAGHPNHRYRYLNDVCAKIESGQCKSGWGLLGCHIQLTVSTSPVSWNPLNTIKFHLNLRSVGCPHCFFQSVTYICSYPLLSCSQCANELK